MAFKDVVPIILHVDSDPTFPQLIVELEYIPVLNFELDFRISLKIIFRNEIDEFKSQYALWSKVHFLLQLGMLNTCLQTEKVNDTC